MNLEPGESKDIIINMEKVFRYNKINYSPLKIVTENYMNNKFISLMIGVLIIYGALLVLVAGMWAMIRYV